MIDPVEEKCFSGRWQNPDRLVSQRDLTGFFLLVLRYA